MWTRFSTYRLRVSAQHRKVRNVSSQLHAVILSESVSWSESSDTSSLVLWPTSPYGRPICGVLQPPLVVPWLQSSNKGYSSHPYASRTALPNRRLKIVLLFPWLPSQGKRPPFSDWLVLGEDRTGNISSHSSSIFALPLSLRKPAVRSLATAISASSTIEPSCHNLCIIM
jgi:hypothetical protein